MDQHRGRDGTLAPAGAPADLDGSADAELLVSVADGDEAALQELYRRHAPMLLSRLASRCADPDVVDQAIQDTFVAVWRRPGAWRGTAPVPAWLWGIAIRRLLDHLGRRSRLRRWLSGDPARTAEQSPEERVLGRIEHGELGQALERLSPELLAVLEATALDGLTTREAAALLDIPVGTVKTRLMRARKQLREALA